MVKKLISTLAIVALVGFAAFKGAVWWFTDQDLRRAQAEIEQQGVITRGTIHSSLVGQVTLTDASYQDFRLTQPLQLSRVTFDAGSPLALMFALVDPRRLPDSWRLAADGARMTLDPNMFRSWVAVNPASEPALFAPPCGPDRRQRLGSGDLLRIGISEVTGEVILTQSRAGLNLEINTDGTGSLELDWPGARLDITDPLAVMDSSASPITLTLRDGGIMRSVTAYCSREMAITGDQWTALARDVFQQQLAGLGYQASPQLAALYRRWLSEGGELSLSLVPNSPTYGIPVNHPGQDMTAMAVQYNGAMVPDVYLQPIVNLVPDEPAEPPASAESDSLADGESGWQNRAVETASQWLGHTVRVTLTTGRVVEGRLAGAEERELEVARPVDGGEVVYPLAVSAITGFEVWRRGAANADN